MKKTVQNFIERHHQSVLNLDSNNLTDKLSNKLNEIFKKNKIPLSEEQMNVIFGLIYNNIKEKDFSTALLNIGNANNLKKLKKRDGEFEGKNVKIHKKKRIFEIFSKKKKKINDNDILFENNNNKEFNKNFYINIEEPNEMIENLDYSEIKNDIQFADYFYEPKKSKVYLIKQFEFEDFIKCSNRNINLDKI